MTIPSSPSRAERQLDLGIRFPAPSAPGSETSQTAADRVSGKQRQIDHHAILLVLAAASEPLSRDDIHDATQIIVSTLCPCLLELQAALVVDRIKGACWSRKKPTLHVNGYRITAFGRERLRGAA